MKIKKKKLSNPAKAMMMLLVLLFVVVVAVILQTWNATTEYERRLRSTEFDIYISLFGCAISFVLGKMENFKKWVLNFKYTKKILWGILIGSIVMLQVLNVFWYHIWLLRYLFAFLLGMSLNLLFLKLDIDLADGGKSAT